MDNSHDSKAGTRPPVKDCTPEARKMLSRAYNEAASLSHRCIEIEHLMIAMIDSDHSVAVKVLIRTGVDLQALRLQLVELANTRSSAKQAYRTWFGKLSSAAASGLRSFLPLPNRLPYSLRIKKVLALAFQEARDFGHPAAGTEHLLLGLIRERDGNVARLLQKLGLTLEGVRKMVAPEIAPGSNR